MDQLQSKITELQHELGQVRERRRTMELAAAEQGQRAAVIEARIQGILEAAEILGASEAKPAVKNRTPGKKRHRPLSGHWKAIMTAVNEGGDSFSYGDLAAYANMIGHQVGRDTLRSQMSGYKSAGLVESVGDGIFRLTELGKAAAGNSGTKSGAEAPNENAAPNGQAKGAAEAAGWGVPPPSPAFVVEPKPWPAAGK